MKRPAFQFYPADWRNNAKLRRCSWGARGVWIEVMGLLHDSDDYGMLRWTLKEFSLALGCPMPLLNELAAKDVLKGADKGRIDPVQFTPKHARAALETVVVMPEASGPLWYSSRMLIDEYKRIKRGGIGEAPNDSPNPPIGEAPNTSPGVSPSRARASSSSTSTTGSATSSPKGDSVAAGDPVKAEIWRTGKTILKTQGVSEDTAGKFLGGLCRDYGQKLVLDAVRDCARTTPAEAKAWLTARCQERRAATSPSSQNAEAIRVALEKDVQRETSADANP